MLTGGAPLAVHAYHYATALSGSHIEQRAGRRSQTGSCVVYGSSAPGVHTVERLVSIDPATCAFAMEVAPGSGSSTHGEATRSLISAPAVPALTGCTTASCDQFFGDWTATASGSPDYISETFVSRCEPIPQGTTARQDCDETTGEAWDRVRLATWPAPGTSCLYQAGDQYPTTSYWEHMPLGWAVTNFDSALSGVNCNSVTTTDHTRLSGVDPTALQCQGTNVFLSIALTGYPDWSQRSTWSAYTDGPAACVAAMTFTHYD